eukprot:EG_transcript_10116
MSIRVYPATDDLTPPDTSADDSPTDSPRPLALDSIGVSATSLSRLRFEAYLLPNHTTWQRLRPLLWYVAGAVLGVCCGAAAYASVAFGNPFVPTSWWHCLVPCAISWMALESSMCSLNMFAMVERRHDVAASFKFGSAVAAYAVGASTMCILWYVIHVASPLHPFYFHGAIAAVTASLAMNLATAFLCVRPAIRQSAAGRRDTILTVLFNTMFLINNLMYWASAAIFLVADSSSAGAAVATTALFISSRVGGTLLSSALIARMSRPDDSSAALGALMVDANHCSFLIVVLGQTSLAVTIMVMVLDLAYTALTLPFIAGWMKAPWHRTLLSKLLQPWGKSPAAALSEDEHLLEVHEAIIHTVIGELTEVLIILSYTPLYLICRAGRNSEWMAGMGANIWNYSTPSIASFLTNMLAALAVELVTGLLNYLLLRRFAQLSLMELAAHVARYWGPNICCTYAFVLYHQMCITIVHCGMDLTFHEHGDWVDKYSYTPWG